MNRPKLNYRFHNPNPTDEELTRVLLQVCVDANRKKVENAIREGALKDNAAQRVIAVNNVAVVAELEGKTLFVMPKGEYERKTYSIPSEYIKCENRERVLKLPQDFKVELDEKGEITDKLTINEFVKAVSGKTEIDYEIEVYKRPSELAKKQAKKSLTKRKALISQNVK